MPPKTGHPFKTQGAKSTCGTCTGSQPRGVTNRRRCFIGAFYVVSNNISLVVRGVEDKLPATCRLHILQRALLNND